MDPNSINPAEVELREQDRWLPIANVARLMKNTLPGSAKVSKDAKECMQECVSEFISFVTSEASDRCIREKRKTINGEDILFSMHDLGFENYAEVLKIFLAKYREQQALKHERGETKMTRKQLRAQAAAEAAAASAEVDGSAADEDDEDPEEDQASDMKREVSAQSFEPLKSVENGSNADSVASQESYFDQYEGHNETDHTNDINGKKSKLSPNNKDEYEYNDFIDNNDNHPNIDELTKQLTNDEPDIDTLTAGITNGSTGNDYF